MRRTIVWGAIFLVVFLASKLFMHGPPWPSEDYVMDGSEGPLNAFLQQVLGHWVPTDFQSDYVSAKALLAGNDPYQRGEDMFPVYGAPSWGFGVANPHPPTMVALTIPFALLEYQSAITAWSVLMIFVLIWTFSLMGVPRSVSIAAGLGVAITFPGAYAIGNAVPLIGLGIALAHRFRDNPMIAGLGLTMAATPKSSGLLLALPFLLSARRLTVAWAALLTAIVAIAPLAFYPDVWHRYVAAGLDAIRAVQARPDNASILHLAATWGLPQLVVMLSLTLVTLLLVLGTRNTYWPTVWLMVAALPISWTYSMLTLIPIYCMCVKRRTFWSIASVVIGAGLVVACPPWGLWPTYVVPIVLLMAALAVWQIRDSSFWLDGRLTDGVRRRGRRPDGAGAPPDAAEMPKTDAATDRLPMG
jgi:Glycosyltransferase family 87